MRSPDGRRTHPLVPILEGLTATIAVAALIHLARPDSVATLHGIPIFAVPIVFGAAYGFLVGLPVLLLSIAVSYLGIPFMVHLRSEGLTVYARLLDEAVQSLWLPIALLSVVAVAVSAVASARNKWVTVYRDRFKAIARRKSRFEAGSSTRRGPGAQIRALPRTSPEAFLGELSKHVASVVGGKPAAPAYVAPDKDAARREPQFAVVRWVAENGLPYSACLQPEFPSPQELAAPDLALPISAFGSVYAVITMKVRRSDEPSDREKMRHERAAMLAELAGPALESALRYRRVAEVAGGADGVVRGVAFLRAAGMTAELCPTGHSHGLLLLQPVRRVSSPPDPDVRRWIAPYLPVRSLPVVLDSPACTAVLIPHIGSTGCAIIAMDLLAVPIEENTELALAYETWSTHDAFPAAFANAIRKLSDHRKTLWD